MLGKIFVFALSFARSPFGSGVGDRHIEKGVVLTLYLWRSESRKFKIFHKMKQWPTPIMVVYTFPVYTNSVGFGIAYPWKVGNARASERGMSNSSDTRASFLGVFLE